MARPHQNPDEVVHVLSDSEDEDDQYVFAAQYNLPAEVRDARDMDDMLGQLNEQNTPEFGAVDSIVDLTNISDRQSPPRAPVTRPAELARLPTPGASYITEAACLQMILNVLPDISDEHALGLIRVNTQDDTRTLAQCENMISQLLDAGSYPKTADQIKNKKRKRDDEEEWTMYEKGEVASYPPTYSSEVLELLRDEFLELPIRTIADIVKDKVTLYKAYIELDQKLRDYGPGSGFRKLHNARNSRGMEYVLIESGSQTPKELHAVRKKLEIETAKRHKVEELQRAEDENFRQAQVNGQTAECVCCFGETALNRMFSCSGEDAHMYCEECPKVQVETLIGQSRHTINCFGVTDCYGTFSRRQLQTFLPAKTFERLEHMQQQAELAAAGLDFLSECPFCDFKMECPPVEIDKEFRCQSKKCGKTSCRLCQKETHVPLSCEEAKKDSQLTLRHVVEEAMTAALIRKCNRCKRPFIKDIGCNKMNCSNCGNLQCYVCSQDVEDYQHFGEVGQGRCPLHENVEERHEREIKDAADEVMAKVHAENPGLSQEDLMIKVSDRVKAAEDKRKGHARAQAQHFPYIMVGNELQRRPVIQAAAQAGGQLGAHMANLVAGRGRPLPPPAQHPPQAQPQYVPQRLAAPLPNLPLRPDPLVQMYHPQYQHVYHDFARQRPILQNPPQQLALPLQQYQPALVQPHDPLLFHNAPTAPQNPDQPGQYAGFGQNAQQPQNWPPREGGGFGPVWF